MVDEAFFRWLLKRPEGTTLDFKRDTQLSTKNARNDFIKDIVSMANTERETPSYIVVGVSWTPEGGAVIHGMDKQIDDALLIDAIGTDRIQPIPRFTNVLLDQRFGKIVVTISTPLWLGSVRGGPLQVSHAISKR